MATSPSRRPRFRRASEPLPFRLTESDIAIVRLLARHRFLRSTHIAALVSRSLDRVNDRLLRLFHAGYVDRPRAQLDHYPDSGSAPMVYALSNRGARLLAERDGSSFSSSEWSRKNETAGRRFIEHQLEIMDFYVALQIGTRGRTDVTLIHPHELVAVFPEPSIATRDPFALRVKLTEGGAVHDIGLVPDLAFGLRFPDGSRRCFLVEIDRGTMPVSRSDIHQTSFARKMRAYVTAHAVRLHERQFGWKAFRVLTVTTEQNRLRSMMDALHAIPAPSAPSAGLFWFAVANGLRAGDPLRYLWRDGVNRVVTLI
jgi:hypothetical protein